MKVSTLARTAGVTPDTVRHYVRIGLLEGRKDPVNGYRNFGRRELARLRFIRNATHLGFGLKEIGAIFADAEHGCAPCPRVRELLAARIEETRARVKELEALQRRMEEALESWQDLPDAVPDGESVCHLIERWAEHEEKAHD